jgi:hypothetical protein
VLCARFGVQDARTPVAVCDALIARELGMNGGKMTLDRIRAHVLAHGIDPQAKGSPSPDAKAYPSKVAAWIASSAVGASGTQRKMARALARRWVCGEPQPLGNPLSRDTAGEPVPSGAGEARPAPTLAEPPPRAGVAPSQPPEPEVQRNLPLGPAAAATQPPQNLLEVVRETIPRIGADGRFGEKIYVSAIWRTIERDRKVEHLSLDSFKSWLLGANRKGWLVLARADLIGAMDSRQVTESEIQDRGSTFHFVLDQRNGASTSQRESYAR